MPTDTTETTIEDLKAKLKEFEDGNADKVDKSFEIRLEKSQAKNATLTETLRGLNETITGMEAAEETRKLKTAESSGDFKAIVAMKDAEIEKLQSKFDVSQLDVTRLKIGRKHNLPDGVATLIPGSSSDEIEANAIKIRAEIKPKSGFSDARQSGGVVVTGGPDKKKAPSTYIPVRAAI